MAARRHSDGRMREQLNQEHCSHPRLLLPLIVAAQVGSGVLCLAGGVAAFSDQRQTLVLALGIAFTFAAIAGYCFAMIGKVCEMTGAKSYT